VSYASPERRGHHSLVGAYSTLANNFLIRKVKTKHEKYQNTPNDTLSYTKYPFENTKIPPKVKLFFFWSFLRLKTSFYYVYGKWKNLKYHCPTTQYLFDMQRSIFTLTKPVKDQEISWSMILNFVDFSGKIACIHPHAIF
jgi:hypothetical protein